MDKAQLAQQIGQLEGQIAGAEPEIRKAEDKLSGAKRNRTAGAGAILVAIIGFVFLVGWWPLWGLIAVAGGLTLMTALLNQMDANKELSKQQE